jgi:heme a synthase
METVPGQITAPGGAAAPTQHRVAALARRCADVVLAPSPAAMRGLAVASVAASAGIILTGAGVRLSQSGLGCPDWPTCTATSIVASGATGDPLIHRWVEFGNRLVTVAIFVIAILVWAAAWRFRPDGQGRRRDVLWLASVQPLGILGQAALGGIVVLTDLDPVWVTVHFLFSMALVAAAVALYARCTEGRGPTRLLVPRELRLFAAGAVGVLCLMVAAGTVVTGTGPLAGARSVPRFHLPLGGVTQLHADIGWLLAGLVIALALGLRLLGAPRRAVRLGWVLLALIGAQGVIGYTQYFTGLPAGLVWFHVAGATAIWVVAFRLLFTLRDRGPLDAAGAGGAEDAARP